jgi:phosphotransferase system  glucose/maltose/N-acetylglucosamine-specific IIC component
MLKRISFAAIISSFATILLGLLIYVSIIKVPTGAVQFVAWMQQNHVSYILGLFVFGSGIYALWKFLRRKG